jgi:outer membrane protein TolC
MKIEASFKIKKHLLISILLILSGSGFAQNVSITLEQCYQLAEANYPLSKQRELIDRAKEYSVDNISKGIYPQFYLSASATYQSDVTKIEIPFPGIDIPTISKDQYKMYGEVSQSLTDFPANKMQKQLKTAEAGIQQENLSVELYKLRDRINQLFFGAILIDEQLQQSELLKADIGIGIKQTEAAIKNGTGFHSSLDKLNAEVLKIDQHKIELRATRKAYTDMLGLFINKKIDEQTILVKPSPLLLSDSIRRPELRVFDLQKKSSILQKKIIATKSYPKLSAFFQGGVGKPSPVNLLKRDFAPFYITGLRLNWSLGTLYTFKKEKLLNENDRKIIDVQQTTFLFNTRITLQQQHAEIEKFMSLIETDDEIIRLRESVKKTSAVQLENGVITTNDFLKEVNEEDEARQNKILHELQMLMAQYAEKNNTGN